MAIIFTVCKNIESLCWTFETNTACQYIPHFIIKCILKTMTIEKEKDEEKKKIERKEKMDSARLCLFKGLSINSLVVYQP